MTNETLLGLVDRIEALTGPDREVDHEIQWALGVVPVGVKHSPKYTTSIDFALTLVPVGYEFCVTNGNGAWIRKSAHFPAIQGNNKVPALALCAAAMRAMSFIERECDGNLAK